MSLLRHIQVVAPLRRVVFPVFVLKSLPMLFGAFPVFMHAFYEDAVFKDTYHLQLLVCRDSFEHVQVLFQVQNVFSGNV